MFCFLEFDRLHGLVNFIKILSIIKSYSSIAFAFLQNFVFMNLLDIKFFWSNECVKGMESPLPCRDGYDPWFLEKVTLDVGSFYCVIFTKIHLDILTETTGIIVPDCLAVTKGLKKGITREDFLLYGMMVLLMSVLRMTQWRQNFHAILGWLGFTSSTLTWNYNGLLGIWCLHMQVCFACNHKSVGFIILQIGIQYFLSYPYHWVYVEIFGYVLVWVEHYESRSDVCKDHIFLVPFH